MTNFDRVKEFMEAGQQSTRTMPELADDRTAQLRLDLIEEELDELSEAIFVRDIVGIADALTDILYVVYGTGHTYGIDLDACFKEVHRSNMSKFENGLPVKREDGKIMKGKNYTPPDLERVLILQELTQLAKEYDEEAEADRQPSIF